MVAELIELCEAIDADPSVGAVVVRADGESFCAGADRALLNAVAQDPAAPEQYDLLGAAYRAFVRVGGLLPPSIAAVRGHAVGAGVNLLLATDLRIMATTARIITGFRRIGLHPGGGHFALLGRLAGREAAAALSVFGQPVDGTRAVSLGLAWEALPESEVEPRALELAREAAQDPALSRATVQSFRLELGPPPLPWPAALETERAIQMWSLRRRAQPL
jgi:enoyl-CoA hydratase